MPKLIQKSGLSSNNQLNRTMLQTKAETGKLFSISVGETSGTGVSSRQIQNPGHSARKGRRPEPVTRVKRTVIDNNSW